jgi:hypothetical protein
MNGEIEWEFLEIDKRIFKAWNIPVIEVDLYGFPHLFMLDSGCNDVIVDKKTVEELHNLIHIEDCEEGFTVTGIRETTKVDRGRITITIANANEAIYCNIVEMDSINNTFSGVMEEDIKLSGMLGSNFFAYFNWILDFNRIVVWYPKR